MAQNNLKQKINSFVFGSLILAGLIACSQKRPIAANLHEGRAPGNVEMTRETFFDDTRVYYVRLTNWPLDKLSSQALEEPVISENSTVAIFNFHPSHNDPCPDNVANEDSLIYSNTEFKLSTSGNQTKYTPKSSYKFKMKDNKFLGMSNLNLKSMWNDVSQMREAISWKMFNLAGVPSSRHTYARLCINNEYKGLYSVIEDVDDSFLENHFPHNDKGNLYKAVWENADNGPADLTDKKPICKNPDSELRTYSLKTNDKEKDPVIYKSCKDLEKFVSIINGPADKPEQDLFFSKPEFASQVRSVFDVDSFLRWAAVNNLLGAWDNYWATPGNYYLYNSGGAPAFKKDFINHPYFTWVPWDYDNVLGISYFPNDWQYVDIVDWESSTRDYYKGKKISSLPLIKNLLKNKEFLGLYLDYMEKFLDEFFNQKWVENYMNQTWSTIQKSEKLETDLNGNIRTHRQFTNEQVDINGYQNNFLQKDGARIFGIKHFVIMRHDSAKKQIIEKRAKLEASH
jgi:spore coat protein CotH